MNSRDLRHSRLNQWLLVMCTILTSLKNWLSIQICCCRLFFYHYKWTIFASSPVLCAMLMLVGVQCSCFSFSPWKFNWVVESVWYLEIVDSHLWFFFFGIQWVVGLVMQINDDSKGELCSKMPFTSLLRAHLREWPGEAISVWYLFQRISD